MIADPWIILRIDRTELGAGMWALRAAIRIGLPPRRTRDPHRAWRFRTCRQAENAARKQQQASDASVLLVVVRLEDADLPRPKPDPRYAQLALPFARVEDLDRWDAQPPGPSSPKPSPSSGRRKSARGAARAGST